MKGRKAALEQTGYSVCQNNENVWSVITVLEKGMCLKLISQNDEIEK